MSAFFDGNHWRVKDGDVMRQATHAEVKEAKKKALREAIYDHNGIPYIRIRVDSANEISRPATPEEIAAHANCIVSEAGEVTHTQPKRGPGRPRKSA